MNTEREKKYKIKRIFNKAKAKKIESRERDGYADTRSIENSKQIRPWRRSIQSKKSTLEVTRQYYQVTQK